jgi:hypothetical protein
MPAIRPWMRWLAAGVAVIIIGALAALAIIAFGLRSPGGYFEAAASPSPSPSAPVMAGGPTMPIGEDCLGCHLTKEGGIGTDPIPALAHPLEGWTECTACHAPERLVQTAPGHDGIHAQQCLSCHKATTAAAPPRPHPPTQSQGCLSCHGASAPLPADMSGRSETTCWLCHQSASLEAPHFLHPISDDQACASCHAQGEAGALPASHDGRTDDTCTSCHQPSSDEVPVAPHDIASRAGMCSFCHAETTSTR